MNGSSERGAWADGSLGQILCFVKDHSFALIFLVVHWISLLQLFGLHGSWHHIWNRFFLVTGDVRDGNCRT